MLNLCKGRLKEWSKQKFRQRKEHIEQLTGQLCDLQLHWKENFEQIQETSIQLDRLWEQEESYWQQRSRLKWLQQGDANTSFFHQSMMQQRRQNKILKLMDANGQWVKKDNLFRKTIEEHFKALFTSNGTRDWRSLLDCVDRKVTSEMNCTLTRAIDDSEIEDAV